MQIEPKQMLHSKNGLKFIEKQIDQFTARFQTISVLIYHSINRLVFIHALPFHFISFEYAGTIDAHLLPQNVDCILI